MLANIDWSLRKKAEYVNILVKLRVGLCCFDR